MAINVPKKMSKRLAELISLGYDKSSIARALSKEFKEKVTPQNISTLIKRQVVMRKQIIKTDREFREIYKETLMNFLDKVNENTKVLENIRQVLIERFEELKKDIPESKLMKFSRELQTSIRTQNDTARTMNELLKRMESETTEMKVSQVQAIQETLGMLKNLEDMGFITINKDFYNSEIYNEFKNRGEQESED